jgi:hypothetical protein
LSACKTSINAEPIIPVEPLMRIFISTPPLSLSPTEKNFSLDGATSKCHFERSEKFFKANISAIKIPLLGRNGNALAHDPSSQSRGRGYYLKTCLYIASSKPTINVRSLRNAGARKFPVRPINNSANAAVSILCFARNSRVLAQVFQLGR